MPPRQEGPYEPGPDPPSGPSGGQTGVPGPIGVSDDYPDKRWRPSLGGLPRAEQHAGNPLHNTPGFYMDGDEVLPQNYSADRIAQIQVAMERAGLLSPGYSLGIWDPPTLAAYKYLLGAANAASETAEQTLNRMLAVVEAGGGPPTDVSGTAPPLIVQQTDPETLRGIFRRAIIDLAGVGWSQDQINSAIAAYHQIETQRQTEAYNVQYGAGGMGGVGGTITDIPSPEAFIESKVRAEQPEAVAGEEALDFIGNFVRMATGSGGGLG